MDLVDTLSNVRYWSKIFPLFRCSIPIPHLTDLDVKVTDLEFFMINEMSISSESIRLSNIRTLQFLLQFHNYSPQGTCHDQMGLQVSI